MHSKKSRIDLVLDRIDCNVGVYLKRFSARPKAPLLFEFVFRKDPSRRDAR